MGWYVVITRINQEGVLLRYNVETPLPPDVLKAGGWVSDHERCLVIVAHHEVRVLEIIVEHLDLSDIGLCRIHRAMRIIRRALDFSPAKRFAKSWPEA